MIYRINIAVTGFWAAVQWWYATKDHRLIDPNLDPTFITVMSRRSFLGTIINLIAAALSFVSTTLSLVLFIVIPIYYLIPARSDKPWLWFTRNKWINQSPTEFPGSKTGVAAYLAPGPS